MKTAPDLPDRVEWLTERSVNWRGDFDAADCQVAFVEDRPTSGMWHCGPNAAWVTATHLPTMMSVRAFDMQHHKAKRNAMDCLQMLVEQSRLIKCQFPERVKP